MTEYFRKFEIEDKYQSTQIVFERTGPLANSWEYELGYWIQAFIHVYSPGVWFRAINAFGSIDNYMELRYLMEHAVYDPTHPLHNLDYETCSAEDRKLLDVFIEIARTCCYCGYAILKRDRPNLLPKKERKPLTVKEEKSIRWMIAYYTNSGKRQEQRAFSRYIDRFMEIYPKQTPTAKEIEEYNIIRFGCPQSPWDIKIK